MGLGARARVRNRGRGEGLARPRPSRGLGFVRDEMLAKNGRERRPRVGRAIARRTILLDLLVEIVDIYRGARGNITHGGDGRRSPRARRCLALSPGNALRLVGIVVLSIDLATRLKSIHFDTREDHARARRGIGRARARRHANIGIACASNSNANARLRLRPPRWRDVPCRRRRHPRRASRPPTTRAAKRVRRVRRVRLERVRL